MCNLLSMCVLIAMHRKPLTQTHTQRGASFFILRKSIWCSEWNRHAYREIGTGSELLRPHFERAEKKRNISLNIRTETKSMSSVGIVRAQPNSICIQIGKFASQEPRPKTKSHVLNSQSSQFHASTQERWFGELVIINLHQMHNFRIQFHARLFLMIGDREHLDAQRCH